MMGTIRVFVKIWSSQLDEELLIGASVVTKVDSSADILVFMFNCELVMPRYDSSWFRSSESCRRTVEWVEIASVRRMMSSSFATILV